MDSLRELKLFKRDFIAGRMYHLIRKRVMTNHQRILWPKRWSPSALLLVAVVWQCNANELTVAQEPTVSRILFGSCIKQDQPMPILKTIVKREPDLFIFLGDNIYADTTDMNVMRAKYEKLGADAGFTKLLKTCPILATWDESARRHRPGIYDAKVFGPQGKRVQIILLDTRYFRGPLEVGPKRVGGTYVPAEVRIITSGIQCVSESAGHETWSNLPHERQRLFDLVASTDAAGVLLISGDRHWAELSVEKQSVPYPIYDLTSSSLNQIHPRGTPTENRHRLTPTTYHQENFGEIVIHWEQADPQMQLRILDIDNQVKLQETIILNQLR